MTVLIDFNQEEANFLQVVACKTLAALAEAAATQAKARPIVGLQ